MSSSVDTPHFHFSPRTLTTMNRSLSILSALTLSSAALLSVQPQEVNAMTIAFDCFERSTEKLVARSAVDMTSTAISCLPVPGTTLTEDSGIDSEDDDIIVDNTGTDEDFDQDADSDVDIADEDITDEDIADEDIAFEDEDVYEDETNPEASTGSQLGEALGKHIGDLLVQGINDLFR
ncbi:hypothetical protein [Synechococcus sp. UW179A]|uniref:hypothetical protein n=1 Tax=Synechococcus sp. UW179A TaxID=2575510 RepID=UPI0010BEC32B|nr:hypothetical protein [Synechococcus sp. UW179A]